MKIPRIWATAGETLAQNFILEHFPNKSVIKAEEKDYTQYTIKLDELEPTLVLTLTAKTKSVSTALDKGPSSDLHAVGGEKIIEVGPLAHKELEEHWAYLQKTKKPDFVSAEFSLNRVGSTEIRWKAPSQHTRGSELVINDDLVLEVGKNQELDKFTLTTHLGSEFNMGGLSMTRSRPMFYGHSSQATQLIPELKTPEAFTALVHKQRTVYVEQINQQVAEKQRRIELEKYLIEMTPKNIKEFEKLIPTEVRLANVDYHPATKADSEKKTNALPGRFEFQFNDMERWTVMITEDKFKWQPGAELDATQFANLGKISTALGQAGLFKKITTMLLARPQELKIPDTQELTSELELS